MGRPPGGRVHARRVGGVSADRSTEEGWLRKLEEVADATDGDRLNRTFVFRDILAKAWKAGWDRGYSDHSSDVWRAEYAQQKAEREAATEKEN